MPSYSKGRNFDGLYNTKFEAYVDYGRSMLNKEKIVVPTADFDPSPYTVRPPPSLSMRHSLDRP